VEVLPVLRWVLVETAGQTHLSRQQQEVGLLEAQVAQSPMVVAGLRAFLLGRGLAVRGLPSHQKVLLASEEAEY
jgi:hypothetical protein